MTKEDKTDSNEELVNNLLASDKFVERIQQTRSPGPEDKEAAALARVREKRAAQKPAQLESRAKRIWLITNLMRHYEESADGMQERTPPLSAEEFLRELKEMSGPGEKAIKATQNLLSSQTAYMSDMRLYAYALSGLPRLFANRDIRTMAFSENLENLETFIKEKYPKALDGYDHFKRQLHCKETREFKDIQVSLGNLASFAETTIDDPQELESIKKLLEAYSKQEDKQR